MKMSLVAVATLALGALSIATVPGCDKQSPPPSHPAAPVNGGHADVTYRHPSAALDRTPRKVFIVHSYENDNVCGVSQDKGVARALQEAFGDSTSLVRHFMDTKTTNRTKPLMQAEAKKVLARIAEEKPDLVFTIDDNAFREVGLALLGTETPVVFTGMNGQPADYDKTAPFLDDAGLPNANITGVYEKLQLVPSLRVLKMVLPEARKIVVLLDDSTTGKAIRVQLQREMPENDTGIGVDIRMVSTLAEYRKQIASINDDRDASGVYNIVLSIRDDQGQPLTAAHNFREYLQTCKKPSLALNFTFAKLGLFGGASVDFEAMGYLAGQMGCRVLKGDDVASIPIANTEKVMVTFNKARADALGVEIPPELLTASQLFLDMPLLEEHED